MNVFKVLSFFLVMLLIVKEYHAEDSQLMIYKEIAVIPDKDIEEHFTSLTPQERIFIYYMFRASLPGQSIAVDQIHRHGHQIRSLLEYLYDNKQELQAKKLNFDIVEFLKELEIYLVYHWTNHGHYFLREHQNDKRTPQKLNLSYLTKENISAALSSLGYENVQETMNSLDETLFNQAHESNLVVPNSIEHSAGNFYSEDFTEANYASLSPFEQNKLNAYFDVEITNGVRIPRMHSICVGGKYDKEVCAIVYWLTKAYEHAQKYPQQFDTHLVKSLEHLIAYFKTGDEELFKEHSKEWAQMNNRVDYTFGFIETYQDPKSVRALFQSDVTIKSIAIDELNKILPSLEKRLPVSDEFKRDLGPDASLPNASINVEAFRSGDLGPIQLVQAYCLPNYEELRSEYGSKQIMYPLRKSLGEHLNPDVYHQLFNLKKYQEWHKKHDPEYQIEKDLLMLEVILHETLGHGSGKLAQHTFKEGDALTIGGNSYRVGDTLPVTSANVTEFLAGYDHAIEELRAEILALSACIDGYDEFARLGFLKEWPKKLSKEEIIDRMLFGMMRTGVNRLLNQDETAQEIAGDHARANMTILNYCIERGGVAIQEEAVQIDGEPYTVIDVEIIDRNKAIAAVQELAAEVQRIKSTGDGQAAAHLINTYGKVFNPRHLKELHKNKKRALGDVKTIATLFPFYQLHSDSKGNPVDVVHRWPKSIAEQFALYRDLTFSNV